MGRKLYVGNLPFNTDDADLRDLFSQAGVCESSTVISDRETGRSRGFAFAELAPEADMASAIQQLNGQMVEGRPLTVNEAREQKPRSFGGGGGGGFDRNRNRFGKRGGGGRDNRHRGEF